ncbi:MAG: type II secretion system GspH family protein [Thermoanaerobaculia bacterium]|nr:type II secretion system GspH family protein [Thermoanaerobaculia bacterium]
MRERGFTLIETLAGLLILAFVLTTSLLIFTQRQQRLREADEMIVAWQALSNEAEFVRLSSYGTLEAGSSRPFETGSPLLSTLDRATTAVSVADWKPGLKRVVLTVTWNDGARHATLTVIRSATPGGQFW